MHRTTMRTLALLAATALWVTACTPEKEQASPTAMPTAPAAPTEAPVSPEPSGDGIYDQAVTWDPCSAIECATIEVPLDWDNTEGQRIEVALARHRATDPSQRLGVVLINPGGPGSSGIDFLTYFVSIAGDQLLAHYDVVAFDPRGVGQSTPVWCGTDEELDAYLTADVEIVTEEDLERERERIEAFAESCLETSGPIVRHIDTVSAARDMDVIRAVLGDDELNMLGFSYGSQLALTYAELHPETVGRIVLDGVVDPLMSGADLSAGQAGGFEESLTAFLEWCVGDSSCELGPDVDRAREQVQMMMDRARTEGYRTLTNRRVNGNIMLIGTVVALYSEESWPFLGMGLTEIWNSGDGTLMSTLADFYYDRDTVTGRFSSNSMIAFTAIGCLDRYEGEPATLEEVVDFAAEAEELSPTFGWWFGSGLGCDGWPWVAEQVLDSLDNAATANPMLLVGTSNDPATPLEWAESLSDRLEMPLLVFEGEGHTAYGRSNQCVIDTVDAYMVEGTLPSSGQAC